MECTRMKYLYHMDILYNLITQAQCWLDKQPTITIYGMYKDEVFVSQEYFV